MKKSILNILAVLIGLVIGSGVNMGLITLGPLLIPLPDGVNPNDMESLAESMHLFAPKHFIFPFLAHALGTLVGASGAYLIASSYRKLMAYMVGAIFLFGGIWAATMLPSPRWFLILDLLMAYLPMAFLAALICARLRRASE